MEVLKSRLNLFLFLLVFGCAAPLKTDTVSFKLPSSYPNYKNLDGLHVAVVPVSSLEQTEKIFGTDLKEANILPLQLVVKNNSVKEFEINHQQIFGITPNDELTVAYNLSKTAEHVRSSSIGTTAATGAVAGALAGAAIGAGLGAAISDNSGSGAATGAAIGGAAGGTSGAASGMSDSITSRFKRELANLSFGDRVIFQGDIQQGFIYFKWQNYNQIRLNVFNITDNKMNELIFNISVAR